jgi:hypothetical protein
MVEVSSNKNTYSTIGFTRYHTGYAKSADLLYARHQDSAMKDLRWQRQQLTTVTVTATVVENLWKLKYFPESPKWRKGHPFPCAMQLQPSRYPLPLQQRPEQVQRTAVDEIGREQWKLVATNEMWAKKMHAPIQSRESSQTAETYREHIVENRSERR